MKKKNIKKTKPFLKLILIYFIFMLFTCGVVKVCALCNAMDNITLIIGCTALLVESVYLGFYFGGKKNRSIGECIGYGFFSLIIGVIVLWTTWYLTSLLVGFGDLIFNLPNNLEGFNFDRGFLIYFILVQFNLFALYRFISKKRNKSSEDGLSISKEDNTKSGNE